MTQWCSGQSRSSNLTLIWQLFLIQHFLTQKSTQTKNYIALILFTSPNPLPENVLHKLHETGLLQ